MSRSGYSDDYDNWAMICWRGAVKSAIRGKRGQAFLKEMVAALDAMPVKQLIAHDLEVRPNALWFWDDYEYDHSIWWGNWYAKQREELPSQPRVCALGSVGRARRLDMRNLDPEDRETVAATFDIPRALSCEIMAENDETYPYSDDRESRWRRMRQWAVGHIKAGGT